MDSKWVTAYKTICRWFWGGLFLFKMGWKCRFNFKSPYVRWRLETAWGDPEMKWSWHRIKRMIDYGYWAHKIKNDSF